MWAEYLTSSPQHLRTVSSSAWNFDTLSKTPLKRLLLVLPMLQTLLMKLVLIIKLALLMRLMQLMVLMPLTTCKLM